MLLLSQRTMVSIAGGMWAIAGVMLAAAGVRLLGPANERKVYLLAILAVALGVTKGHLVMRRMAHRNLTRIRTLPGPGRYWEVYRPGGWAFIAAMMLLGLTLRHLNGLFAAQWAPAALGVVDLAVGVALLVGATRYLKGAATIPV
ncbi:MAG: hypothetical protein ACYS7M_11785 [Planctomycetota bacterium]